MRVKPRIPGTVIRDPVTRQPLPPGGARVPMTSFWLRRLRSGDVVQLPDDEERRPELDPLAPLATRGEEP